MTTPLREAPFAFMDLLHATSQRSTRFQCSAEEVRYACGVCDATFEQNADGWRAFRDHEGEHGASMCVDLAELDGKTLRIVTWAVTSTILLSEFKKPEIWGIDDERGVVYCLSNSYQQDKVWKWRINTRQSGLLAALNAPTPSAQD